MQIGERGEEAFKFSSFFMALLVIAAFITNDNYRARVARSLDRSEFDALELRDWRVHVIFACE